LVEHILTDGSAQDPWMWFLKAVELCYQRPENAVRRMTRYRSTKGQAALLKKLARHPAYFGRQRMLPPRAPISRLRRQKHCAIALLPLLAKDALDAGQNDFVRSNP
jgi:hypothetical protein